MKEFFTNIYKNIPQDQWITIWTLRDKRTEWFKSIDKIEEYVKTLQNENVFFGIGTSRTKHGNNKRLSAKEIDGIGCIHIDIDYGNDGHKKHNLPPNIKEAITIANKIIVPSYIINSGNGIHAYYLFDKYITGVQEITRAAEILKDFQSITSAYTEYEIDMTHDLARVLRVPTTFNCKDPQNQKECKIIVNNSDIRYSLDEIASSIETYVSNNTAVKTSPFQQHFREKELFCKPENQPKNQIDYTPDEQSNLYGKDLIYANIPTDEKYRIINRRIVRTPDRKLSDEKFMDMKMTFEDFESVFTHKKKHKGDSSLSSYDMMLANMAATAELSEQEICDLLIQHRTYHKKHNTYDIVQFKLTHPTYYGSTIYKAIVKYEYEKSPEEKQIEIENAGDNKEEATPDAVQDQIKDQFLKQVSDVIGVEIVRAVKYDQEPEPIFEITLKSGKIIDMGTFNQCFGSIKGFQSTINKNLMGVKGTKAFAKMDKQRWNNLLRWFHEIMEIVVVSEEMYIIPRMTKWLIEYRDSTSVKIDIEEFEKRSGESLLLNNTLYFDDNQFWKYIKTNYDNKITMQSLKIILHKMDCRYDKIKNSKGTYEVCFVNNLK